MRKFVFLGISLILVLITSTSGKYRSLYDDVVRVYPGHIFFPEIYNDDLITKIPVTEFPAFLEDSISKNEMSFNVDGIVVYKNKGMMSSFSSFLVKLLKVCPNVRIIGEYQEAVYLKTNDYVLFWDKFKMDDLKKNQVRKNFINDLESPIKTTHSINPYYLVDGNDIYRVSLIRADNKGNKNYIIPIIADESPTYLVSTDIIVGER